MASFYLEAASVLDAVAAHNNSLKAIVANSTGKANNQSHKRRLLALCANTLAYATILDEIIERTELLVPSKQAPDWVKGGAAPPPAAPPPKQQGQGNRKGKRPPSAPPRPKIQGKDKPRFEGRPSAANLARVLLHDLLISPAEKIQAGASYPPNINLTSQRARLHAALVRIQLARGAQTLDELRSDRDERQAMSRVPRWVRLVPSRVGVVVGKEEDPVEHWETWLGSRGLQRVESPRDGVWLDPSGKEYALSAHVPHVYAFHPSFTSTLLASDWYRLGAIVLQDLASCFPAQLLASYCFGRRPTSQNSGKQLQGTNATIVNPEDSKVRALDATAAPGNKTSHLSTLLHHQAPQWSLGALERDRKRYLTLMNQLKRVGALATDKQGARNTTAVQGDFLALDPLHEDWTQVRILLLDPSCSGSGILGRWDQLTSAPTDEAEDLEEGHDRLAQLSALQVKMIEQAMKLPALEAFTYSTCSIHKEENEEVVARALQLPLAQERGWRVVPQAEQASLGEWPQRGMPLQEMEGNVDTSAVLRAYPGGSFDSAHLEPVSGACHTHASNGFFVALFARDPKFQPVRVKKRKASPPTIPDAPTTAPTEHVQPEVTKLSKGQKKKLKKRRQNEY